MTMPQPLQRHISLVEDSLRDLFAGHSSPLYRLMEYQLGWRDERGDPLEAPVPQPRLHAGICLLAAQSTGGDIEKAVPAAAAVELVYQFTQVHADIQDGSQQRHNRPTVWWIWGPAQAINAGDGLHALARLSLLRLHEHGGPPADSLHLMQALDTACLRMCEGLHVELLFQERVDIAPEAYLKMARDKVGALLGCALELGAAAGAPSRNAGASLREFGETLGVACQIQEDIQMLWGQPLSGKATGLDALNKKKGFPVLYSLDHAPIAQKRELGTLFFKRVLEPADLQQVTAILDKLNARPHAQAAARHYLEEATRYLDGAALAPEGRRELSQVATWLALREGNP
ncbi:MAG: polyprenyl synthetase family protein [Dehalococcoidia bacterium]|nr:polyprenyl synthetase family protein [Dehalococcoidia bacterium]